MFVRKKGDPTDVITLIIFLFFLAVAFTVVLYANTILSSVIETTVLNDSTASATILESFDRINASGTQNGFLILFSFLILGVILSSFLVDVHPVFLFIYIITLIFAILLSVYLSNTYSLIAENPLFVEALSYTPLIEWIMTHLVMIALGTGVLSMLVIFGKASSSGGGFNL